MTRLALGVPGDRTSKHARQSKASGVEALFLKTSKLRAVLSDSQFWVPAVVLAIGLVLLVALH